MEKFSTAVLIYCSLIVIVIATPHSYIKAERQESLTNLCFFVHDILGGQNQTVWKVAQSNISDTSPSLFGTVFVFDNLVTSGPELASEEVGRLQGLIALSDLNEITLTLLANLVFTTGKYGGSTLAISARIPYFAETHELQVVGGTYVFRMARGYAITRTVYLSPEYGLYEYNVTVFHVDDTGLQSE